MTKFRGEQPTCACGCGELVSWQRGIGKGWRKYVHGHHIRDKNPNTGEHMRGDRSPMKRPEVVAKLSGENHWRNRPENAERAAKYISEQKEKLVGIHNPNWKGGKTLNGEGRVMIRINGEYIPEHRLIMEKHIGRKLESSEIVHHINKDLTDNRIENLELLKDQSEHASIHNRSRRFLNVNDAPVCTCGCGKRVVESQSKPGNWNEYAPGCGWKARYNKININN